MDEREVAYNGISFNFVLFIVFLVLKLTDTIDWSWWWVTAPIWIPFAGLIVFVAICFIIGVVKGTKKFLKERKENGK